jgi:hypothetical protein
MLVIGSRVEIGSSRFRLFRADVAQLVEHSLGKGEVISSILIIGSSKFRRRRVSSGSNSVVESQPSKLLVAGSIPVSRSRFCGIGRESEA